MDNKLLKVRSRSKSVAGVNQRSPTLKHSFDVDKSFDQTKEKNQNHGYVRKYSNLETTGLHNYNKSSLTHLTVDNPKPDVDTLVLPPDRERLAFHRFSLDVRGQLRQDQDEIATYKKLRHNSVFGSIQPLSSFSFHKKNVFDFEKTKAKILDPKKDSLSRMRHLKHLSDKCTFQEIEDFYKKYYNFIYHTIHEFIKAGESQPTRPVPGLSSKNQEAKEYAVYIFEVLLCCVPSVINKKWQYHSIASIIKHMLLAEISSKAFSDGLRLFVMWYSILMENAEESEHMLFSNLVPCRDGSGNYDIFILFNILKFIVIEIKNIHWEEQTNSYNFMLRKLETCYLKKIFPLFKRCDYMSFQYESFGNIEERAERNLPNHQRMITDWLVAIIGSIKRGQSMSREKFGLEELIEKLDAENEEESENQTLTATPTVTGSPLTSDMVVRDNRGKKGRGDRYEFFFNVDEKLTMQKILFSHKLNVNLVLEVFGQAFIGAFDRGDLVKEICHIYKVWLKGQQTPIFLHQKHSLSTKSDLINGEDFKIDKQKLVQIFICQSCTVFFYNWKSTEGLIANSSLYKSPQEQVNICTQALNLYRQLIMDVQMEAQTWTCLLEKLLKICSHVVPLPPDRDSLEDLCRNLIESLLVAFVRASLTCHVPRKLWDQMTEMMVSLMNRNMVVQQWGSTMVMLTKMIGHWLYNIDLLNTSEDSRKPRRKVKHSRAHFHLDPKYEKTEEDAKVEPKDFELTPDESYSSLPPLLVNMTKETFIAKDRERSTNSLEASNPSIEKMLDSSFCISDVEISSNLNEVNRSNDPLPTSADDNVESSKDAQSSFGRSESSESFENSGSSNVLKELDDNITSLQTESMEKSCTPRNDFKGMIREPSVDDKQVEMDLTELKECPLEDDWLRFVWLKMLGIFGNVASMADRHNFLVAQNLKPIHDCMIQIYKHQDFINDNKFPVLVLIPWLLQIIHMPQQLLENKLIAYSMICDYMLHVPLPPDYLSRFYFTIHIGLQSPMKEISRAIIRHYSKQIFGHHLGRGIVLVEDFLHVAHSIICNDEQVPKSQIPDRIEAARMLASFVNIPNHYQNLRVLDPQSLNVQLKQCDLGQLKNIVISILINSINGNQKHSRVCSFSICGLGLYLHEEILLHPDHPLIYPAINCLLSIFSLDDSSNYSNVEKSLACQALSTLRDHHHILHNNFQDILRSILENFLKYVNHSMEAESFVKEFKITYSILMSLLEWFLVLPVAYILESINGISLLDQFFKVLFTAHLVCERSFQENRRDLYVKQLKLFADFVFCHLVNYIGCLHNSQETTSSESQSWQLMTWFDMRIFEAMQSLEKDVQIPLTSHGFYVSPAYAFTMRDITGKWLWCLHAMDAPQTHSAESQLPDMSLSNVNGDSSKTNLSEFEELIDEDILIKALNLINDTSPECCPNSEHQSLTIPFPCSKADPIQDYVNQTLLQQHQEIFDFVRDHRESFTSCKRLSSGLFDILKSDMLLKITQSFGISWPHERNYLDFLNIGEQLTREIKHFDAQRCLETHKVAVFYVGPNQHDKKEILLNRKGSPSFEEFCSQLGDLISLRHHKGFLGGLSTSGSTGEVSPYYSPSSLLQVIFHVSTLLSPSQVDASDEDTCVAKMRHLGNDEVHIIWMDNDKCYTTDFIPTKFGEVTIVIYPLPRHLYRIQILKKIMMDTFGPLFDGSIVGEAMLAALVRATAINAGRAIRETRDHYCRFYEERYSTLFKIVSTYKKQETYEQFLCSSMMPGAGESNPVSFLTVQSKSLAEQMSQQPLRPEKKIKMDVQPNKKLRSDFILPLKVKTEKRA